MHRPHLALLVAGLALASATRAMAQPAAAAPADGCAIARDFLETEPPGERARLAFARLQFCPPAVGAPVLAATLRRWRHSGDQESLGYLGGMLAMWPSEEIVAAVLEVGGDPGASTFARVAALRGMTALLRPTRIIRTLFPAPGATEADACPEAYNVHGSNEPRVTPAQRARMLAIGERILADASAPEMVRLAAACVY